MDKSTEGYPSHTFVVKVYPRDGGGLSGLIEHLRTGEKQPFTELAAIAQLLAAMLRGFDGPPREVPR